MALLPKFVLSDLQQGQPIVDREGKPSDVLLRNLNGNTAATRRILTAIADLLEQIVELNGLVTAVDAKAEGALKEAARISSYTDPTAVLSAADAGSDASITIANHLRVYPVHGTYDVPDLNIIGTTLTGLAYATEYYVYYDDPTLTNTTPTFLTTTVLANSQVGAAPGRHFVGGVTTPAAGQPPTTGGGGRPPGGFGPLEP